MSSHFYYFFAKNKAYLVLEIGFVSDLSEPLYCGSLLLSSFFFAFGFR